MSIPTIRAGGRYYKVTPGIVNVPGYPFIELGPGSTGKVTGYVTVQFAPSLDFQGQFIVVSRPFGGAADDVNTPFVPVMYKLLSLNDVAQPQTLQGDPISGAAQIVVQAPCTSIALLSTCAQGFCELTIWQGEGPAL